MVAFSLITPPLPAAGGCPRALPCLPACLPQWCLVQDLLQVWLTNETSLRPWHHTIYLIYLICMKLETSTRKLRRFFLNLCLFCRSSELERLFELVRLWNAVASLDFTVGFCCFSSNSWTSLCRWWKQGENIKLLKTKRYRIELQNKLQKGTNVCQCLSEIINNSVIQYLFSSLRKRGRPDIAPVHRTIKEAKHPQHDLLIPICNSSMRA